MKHIIYLISIAIVLFVGCNKQEQAPANDHHAGYIFFSKDLATKASLLGSEDMIDQFGVVGFKYDNSITWNSPVNVNLKPSVFGNNLPQTVTIDEDGDPTYSPLQGWSNSKKYAFFAYYPLSNSSVSLVDLNGNPYTSASSGTPAIKYSMNTASLGSSMVDVMIASSVDKYFNSSSDNNLADGEVALHFEHCLSSLGVKVKNSSSGPITLNTVVLNVTGIQYKDMIIALDGDDAKNSVVASGIAENMVGLSVSTISETAIASGAEKELTDKLIFIPQTSEISVSVYVEYQRNAANGYSATTATAFVPTTGSLTTELTKGTKHLIHLNFSESTVNATIGTGAWNDPITVDSTFN